MNHLDEPWRALAKAAKLRDWALVDAVLEDRRVRGFTDVRRGFADARRELGQEEPLAPLDAPNVVTIHDLTPIERESVKIVGTREGDSRQFVTKAA